MPGKVVRLYPHTVTIAGRRSDVLAVYASGLVALHTIFDRIAADGAPFWLSASDVRAFFTANAAALAKRPNVMEELGLLRSRVAEHVWVYCCQHLLRRLTAFDGVLRAFARSCDCSRPYAMALAAEGLLYDVPASMANGANEAGLLAIARGGDVNVFVKSSYARVFLTTALEVCSTLPDELVHMVIEWTWGVRLTGPMLQSLKRELAFKKYRLALASHHNPACSVSSQSTSNRPGPPAARLSPVA